MRLARREQEDFRKDAIVTSVHALQILDEDLPMAEHDIPLSDIVTLGEIIEIDCEFSTAQRDLLADARPRED